MIPLSGHFRSQSWVIFSGTNGIYTAIVVYSYMKQNAVRELFHQSSFFIAAQNLTGGESAAAAAAAAAATPLTYPPTIPYPGIGKTFDVQEC